MILNWTLAPAAGLLAMCARGVVSWTLGWNSSGRSRRDTRTLAVWASRLFPFQKLPRSPKLAGKGNV